VAAAVLSLTFSFIVGALMWLAIGPVLSLHADDNQNEVLNVFAYIAMVFPFVFGVVFFVIENL
jgi:hypothetical protein